MSSVIEHLQSFNRKERFYLISMALGNSTFKLSLDFCKKINKEFSLQLPEHCFVAMDYHLDWLYAGLVLSTHTGELKPFANASKDEISGTQQDIDLIVAYEDEKLNTHIILLEAKGATSFSNAQMRSKAERLTAIFGEEEGRRWPNVIPHFALASPRRPSQLLFDSWPRWMANGQQLRWIQMDLPVGLKSVERCDPHGKASRLGTHWHIKKYLK
ncbi:MAG TPA: hypothetical protein VNL15_05625 [Dehalococcoidia bacterium]|nr:hypothetical protein [Dehalococcoidia bacterium]